MSNKVRNVTKQLLGAEDVAFGRGIMQQNRGGTLVPVHKLDLDLPVADESELALTDTSKYPKASIGSRLFVAVNGQYQELSHIVPVIYRVGGALSAEYPYCENGNVIAKWTGEFPKTLTTADADFSPVGWQIYTVGSGRTIVSETQPPISYGAQGLRWYNPTLPATFVYYDDGTSGQWVEESSQSTDGGIREDLKLLNSTVQIAGVQARKLAASKVFAIHNMPDSQVDFIKTNSVFLQDRSLVRSALQTVIDTVSALSTGETEIDLGGYTYAISGTLSIKPRVWLVNGTIDDNGVAAGNAVVLIGNPLGGSLCRPAGCRNIYLKTTSTAAPVAGFRIDTLVRSSGVENCIAEMNATSTREQNGFEITSTTIAEATAGGVGAYQNWIERCTAINAYWAGRVYTRGTKSQALADPQANGNRIDIRAFSCYRGAVDFGYGAQENEFTIRADTFVTQTAPARIDVVNFDGSFNHGCIVEEIGARAPTQYSMRLGDEAIYNEVSVSTQNIVSGLIDDSACPSGKRAKNIIKQTGSGMISSVSGATGDFGVSQSVAPSQSQFIIGTFVAPARCVVSRFVGVLQAAAPAGGPTRIYAAKNASFGTSNRIVWNPSEPVNAKSIISDTSASVDIPSVWLLSAGDFITFAVDTPSGGGVSALASILVKYY